MMYSLVDEIEAQGANNAGGMRLDSHIMFLTGVPRMVVLTNLLSHDSGSLLEGRLVPMLLVLSLNSVIQAVANFDVYASRRMRQVYRSGRHVRFLAAHYACRLLEVVGRVLVLVAITMIFQSHVKLGICLFLADYFVGVGVLLWVTGFAPGSSRMIMVLSGSLYVVTA